MMKRRTVLLTMILLLALVLAGWVLARPPDRVEINATVIGLEANDTSAGFARAYQPRPFDFPTDHGPHPEYQTEWWYYTGNLATEEGRRFGYQLTFFRRALTPTSPTRTSQWATNQIYMAHFAITDVAQKRFYNFERFSRGAAGLAGATGQPYHVWLENWAVREIKPGIVQLHAANEAVALDLTLQSTKPPALHGQAGLSQKSATPGNASYYYSLTRIATAGTVRIGDTSYPVTGLSWMDHEFGTSYLAENHAGWDWFSLQLDNGQELMFFQIRQNDGGIEPLSGGSLVLPDGTVMPLALEDVALTVQGTWTSPHSGAQYPARWLLEVPRAGLRLEITPLVNDQELNVSYTYWEGAVQVTGTGPTGPVGGLGYVELTGYAQSMQGEF